MKIVTSFRTAYADEGKRLVVGNTLQSKVILGMNTKPNFQEIEVPDFVGESCTVSDIQNVLIQQSKLNLANYLENNPLSSTAKHPEGRLYNVTMEKQNLLLANVSTYQMSVQAGIECPLTWNDTGEECEVWTIEELLQLSMEIKTYVSPLVSFQQHMESKIKACDSVVDILQINIDFTKESIEEYLPLYLEKLGMTPNQE